MHHHSSIFEAKKKKKKKKIRKRDENVKVFAAIDLYRLRFNIGTSVRLLRARPMCRIESIELSSEIAHHSHGMMYAREYGGTQRLMLT